MHSSHRFDLAMSDNGDHIDDMSKEFFVSHDMFSANATAFTKKEVIETLAKKSTVYEAREGSFDKFQVYTTSMPVLCLM